ncbi:MAG: anti-sigma factor [Pseudolysinimonas sp.]
MTPSDELQNAAGAYALNAMSESERAEFETVLAGSEQLRSEVTELMDTAVELGASVAPVDPPASLRASILDAVASTPQLAPETPSVVEPVETQQPLQRPTPAELKARSRWSSPLARLGAVAAAVALIVGLGFTVRAGVQAQSDMATASQINEIQAADDYQRAVVEVDGGGTATVVWSEALRRSALIVDGWSDLPAGTTYELWYMDAEGAATPAGTFDVDDNGSRSIVLAGSMDAGDTIGVTVEPAGGSDNPTTAPIIAVETA